MIASGVVAAFWLFLSLAPARAADLAPGPKLSALIVDGMNNHDWERATRILESILTKSGRFTVDVATSPPAGTRRALAGVEARVRAV